ncbi:MAG: TonB family protein [Thermoanaerobaculia bacterium]
MARNKELEKQSNRTDVEAGEFATFALEDVEDRKAMKFSLWGAVGVHVLLLLINFPAFTAEPQEVDDKERKVFVVQTPKFKPPTLEPEPPRKPREKRIPMPDPTPDDPEPWRVDESRPELELAYDTEIDFAIPNAPPPVDDGPIGPIPVGGNVVAPVKVYAPQPQYTEIARRARIQGVVIVQAIIDKEGDVSNVKLLKSLPMGLGEAAAKAIKTWKFKPATLNGKPVDVYYNLTVNFQLQ